MRGAGEDAPNLAQLLATWAVQVSAEEFHHDADADGVGFGVGGIIGDQEVVVEKLEMMMTVLPQEDTHAVSMLFPTQPSQSQERLR
jgi:hypothetical protein